MDMPRGRSVTAHVHCECYDSEQSAQAFSFSIPSFVCGFGLRQWRWARPCVCVCVCVCAALTWGAPLACQVCRFVGLPHALLALAQKGDWSALQRHTRGAGATPRSETRLSRQ